MLPSYAFTAHLKPSSIYWRLAAVCYAFALLVLWQSFLGFWICLAATSVLVSFFGYSIYAKHPNPDYLQLEYYPGCWTLHRTDGRKDKYDKLYIGFDGGLFIHLVFIRTQQPSRSKRQTRLFLFKDQLSKPQLRIVQLLKKND